MELTLLRSINMLLVHDGRATQVSEQPPDAHRGFDIPPAVITYAEPRAHAPCGVGWRAWGAAAAGAWGEAAAGARSSAHLPTPLLQSLSRARPGVLHSEGLLVQNANADASMPYNVLCLSGTVLAVFAGALLNALIRRRPGKVGKALVELHAAELVR